MQRRTPFCYKKGVKNYILQHKVGKWQTKVREYAA